MEENLMNALILQGFTIDLIGAKVILSTIEKIKEVEDNFSIKDAKEIRAKIIQQQKQE